MESDFTTTDYVWVPMLNLKRSHAFRIAHTEAKNAFELSKTLCQ